jgi:pilus assembly protein CpaB
MLVGIFLAVIAFVGVLLLQQKPPPSTPAAPTEATVIVAAEDIPLGAVIQEEMLTTKVVPIAGKESDVFIDSSQVVGQTARQEVLAGGQITARTVSGGQGTVETISVPPGLRGMTVRVDQVTGVGTLIKAGDWVDVVVRIKIPITPGAPIDNVWDTSSKLLIQGVQVLGTQLPPVAPPAEGETPTDQGAGLSERQELVTLGLTAAQVEAVKFVQNLDINPAWTIQDPSVSLVLRSPLDFIDENGNPRMPESPCITAPLPAPTPAPESPAPSESEVPEYRGCETTDGIVLANLIGTYGVLHPAVPYAEYIVGIGPQLVELQEQLNELQAALAGGAE